MKKLLWTSALALTTMLCMTACDDSSSAKGDDEKENPAGKSGDGPETTDPSFEKNVITSCDIIIFGQHYVCMESADEAYITSECEAIAEQTMGIGEGEIGSGCPEGALKTCEAIDNGVSGTALFYFDGADEASCEELLSDEEEEDDYGFTPDDDEFYMKALKKAAKK